MAQVLLHTCAGTHPCLCYMLLLHNCWLLLCYMLLLFNCCLLLQGL